MYFKETMYLNYPRASKGLPGISKGPLGVKPPELSTYPTARSTEKKLGYVFLGCISKYCRSRLDNRGSILPKNV